MARVPVEGRLRADVSPMLDSAKMRCGGCVVDHGVLGVEAKAGIPL